MDKLFLIYVYVLGSLLILGTQADHTCKLFYGQKVGTLEECETSNETDFYNLPIIGGVYCFNNGSGICKAFSGRFEFLFNTFTDEILGPVPADASKDKHVDQWGMHTRIPLAYNIKGEIVYHDHFINQARHIADSLKARPLSILSVNSFDWCKYAKNDKWPYRSAIKDPTGEYEIYFYNRQTCILPRGSNVSQVYNTRFLHNSTLRIDLDVNPTIFTMEDELVSGSSSQERIRIVKHHRQHWYESPFSVDLVNEAGLRYAIRFKVQEANSKINGSGSHLFSPRSYRKFAPDLCVSNYYTIRSQDTSGQEFNSRLVPTSCGLDQYELADYPMPYSLRKAHFTNHAGLHNIPRYPKASEHFFNIDIKDDEHWKVFAQDGYTFTAMTTIPTEQQDTVKVINLYSHYTRADNVREFDEYYPEPLLYEYMATLNDNQYQLAMTSEQRLTGRIWDNPPLEGTKLINLNYVDDIAYLHKCDTILIIFGALYTEHPASQFGFNTSSYVDSIYWLGIWEMANAFFADPESNTLYVFHRVNYISTISYTCGTDGSLVTGERTGNYLPVHGNGQLPMFNTYKYTTDSPTFQEELFFKMVGVYKGDLGSPEAPDPKQWYQQLTHDEVDTPGSNTLIYIIIAVAVLLIVAMIIISMITMRRRRKRRHFDSAITGRSGIGSVHSKSKRSFLGSIMDTLTGAGSSTATVRSTGGVNSNFPARSTASGKTKRSSGISGSSQGGRRSDGKTIRSRSLSRRKPSATSQASSPSRSDKTRRSNLSTRQHSGNSTTARSASGTSVGSHGSSARAHSSLRGAHSSPKASAARSLSGSRNVK